MRGPDLRTAIIPAFIYRILSCILRQHSPVPATIHCYRGGDGVVTARSVASGERAVKSKRNIKT